MKLIPDNYKWWQVIALGGLLWFGMQLSATLIDLIGPMIEGAARLAAGAAASAHDVGAAEPLLPPG
jgi:hypothetical protein